MSSDFGLRPGRSRTQKFQSPLHRGMSSDWLGSVNRLCEVCSFQSPLHRGMSSDEHMATSFMMAMRDVSIPSSSGHVFGLGIAAVVAASLVGTFQSPLHRGMSSDTSSRPTWKGRMRQVSIPSSSGHVFGQARGDSCRSTQWAGFNPLFIGACLRTSGMARAARPGSTTFQSPLHRGMSSDIVSARSSSDKDLQVAFRRSPSPTIPPA